MIPLFKLFALSTRVFTRPLLNYVKNYHKTNASFANSKLARPFIAIGNLQYNLTMMINRSLFKVETDSDMFNEPLSTDAALQNGVELFYEITVYFLIIGVSIYEMNKYAVEAQKSKEKERDHLERIECKIDAWADKQEAIDEEISKLEQQVNNFSGNRLTWPGLVIEMGLNRIYNKKNNAINE